MAFDAGMVAHVAAELDGALSDGDRLARVGEAALATIPIPWSQLVDDVVSRYAFLVDARR